MRKILVALFFISSLHGFSQGFQKLSPKESGIEFDNFLTEDDTVSGLSYLYLYNGGGVAVGDINNDGLEDIYFTGNQVGDKLYLNLGDLKFKDVTKKYFKGEQFDFHTGATMVDINNDGWLDIFVGAAGPDNDGEKRRNKLYINQQGKKFTNQAKQYGLDDSLNTTQATFFDADNDGDLDCYVLNHVYNRENAQYHFPLSKIQRVIGDDKLMINEEGVFVDKTKESGIESTGFGLGVITTDINNDGYLDIYVTNDFVYPDKLFINNGRGRFHDQILTKTPHISLFAMGVDAGDINNDGWQDIFTADMASNDHVRSKKNMSGMSSKSFWQIVNDNKHYQYMFNSLQLNTGGKYIEIALQAGVSSTDWSWAALFGDYDNDGYQDLFVANGYVRDIRDNDFKNKYDAEIEYSKEFVSFEEFTKMIPQTKLRNNIFKNTGELKFEDKSVDWGLSEKINVNGATHADLDNDGDLDLICNAINDVSFILENRTNNSSFLTVKLENVPSSAVLFGTKVFVYADNQILLREVQPTRGFQSAVSSKVHFGLGIINEIDSIVVHWYNKGSQKLENVKPGQLTIDYNPKGRSEVIARSFEVPFSRAKIRGIADLEHEESYHDDFTKEVLLPHKMSELGPFITVEDIDGDGKEDVFIGGARGYAAKMLFQQDGRFVAMNDSLFQLDLQSEDMESIFIDYDNDGDLDLYVVSGGNEAPEGHASFQDRLYENKGNRLFVKTVDILPSLVFSGQVVKKIDWNKDGYDDLFVFGRQVPEAYPTPVTSHILINNKGKFEDKTVEIAPEFMNLGMVTDAEFSDLNGDGKEDLIVVGEWMPITIFYNKNQKLIDKTFDLELDKTVGWWNSIDVLMDQKDNKKFVLGNIGENNKFHPSPKKHFQIFMNDFDKNGTNDIVLAKNQAETLFPVRGRQCSSEQMPFIKDKFPTYTEFATADVKSIYSEKALNESVHYEANSFSHMVLNVYNNTFKLDSLPSDFQTGPINKTLVEDFDGDGILDMLALGNRFEAEVETIRYDGNPGYYLSGSRGETHPVPLGLLENIKSAEIIEIDGKKHVLIGCNQSRYLLFSY